MQKTEIDDYGVETKVSTAPKVEKKDPVADAEEVDEEAMYGEAIEYKKSDESSSIVPKVENQWHLS